MTATAVAEASAVQTLPSLATRPSHRRDCFQVFAGSPHALVYGRIPNRTRGCSEITARLIVRSDNGASRTLETDFPFTRYDNWSLSGNTLAAEALSSPGNAVQWWNVATGESGLLTLPGHQSPRGGQRFSTYISAEPDGVLFITGRGALKLESFTGVVTRWVRLFRNSAVSFAYASDSAVVLSHGRKLRYVTFDHPTKADVLRDGRSDTTRCLGMSERYAACALRGIQHRYKVPALVALDGSPPIITRDGKHHGTGPVAIAGAQTLFWFRLQGRGLDRPLLTSRTGDQRKRVQGTQRVGNGHRHPMVSAYGEALVTSRAGHKILAATTARKVATLVEAD